MAASRQARRVGRVGMGLPSVVGLCLVVACFFLVLGVGSASARLTRVDGVSDQNLAHWDNAAFNVGSFSNAYFPNLFRSVWVGGSPATHITMARFVVPWDVMGDTSDERLYYGLFTAWLEDVKWLGLTPEVAVEQASQAVISGGVELARVPSSSAQYEQYVSALLGHASAVGEPVADLEAWNEPNNNGVGAVNVGHPNAVAAAHFMNTATALCATYGCTAIAGDFLDSEYAWYGHGEVSEAGKGLGLNYEKEYETGLSGNPVNWGIHPYGAVKYKTPEPISTFESNLPSGSGGHIVSFTEVGAYYCQQGGGYPAGGQAEKEAQQVTDAEYLNTLLNSYFEVAHSFYYEFSNGYGQETNCSTGSDTSLYNDEDHPRRAASVVFGGAIPTPSAPTATTSGASGVQPLHATLNGTVNPNATDTHYYFKYGKTISYGLTTSEEDAGSGTSSVGKSATLALEPGTTYHYRIIAKSYWGTTEGSDQEFKTPGPVEAVTGAVSGVTEEQATLNGTVNPKGYDSKYYFQYGTTTSYGSVTTEGDAGAGSSPEAEKATITGLQPGTTYHYRLVATSGGVTSEGHDQTLSTAPRPSVVLTANGNIHVLVRLRDGEIAEDQWAASTNEWHLYATAVGAGLGVGTPSALVTSNGNIHVMVRLTDGEIADDEWVASENKWHLYGTAAVAGDAAGDPSAIVTSNGNIHVYFKFNDGEIVEDQWAASTNEWHLYATAVGAGEW
jgi:hypothetical protein